jgi:hypothetical protein
MRALIRPAALRAAAWPLLVTGAVLLLLAPGLGPHRQLAWRDSVRLFAPLRPVIAEALRDGRLPLWDPYDGTGTPLLAQLIHGVLHPASLALALLAPGAHLDVLLVTYFLLAGLGAYLAARTLGAEPAAAAAAGVGYAGSGYVLGSAAFLTFLAGAATLPWLVAAGRRVGQGARLSMVALALATAAALLAGDVQVAAVGAALALALALQAGGLAVLPRVAAGFATGALLAGVQLLASWRFLPLTSRALGLSPAEREQWALLPWRLPELVAPGWLAGRPGDVAPAVYRALEPASLFPLPFATSIFVGSALLAAALAAVRVRQARPLLLAAPVLLWLALGHRLGAQQALAAVPVWGDLRYAEKLVGPLSLVLALLASLGLPRLASSMPLKTVGGLAAGASLLAGLAALPSVAAAALGRALPAEAVPAARIQALAGLVQLALGLAALAALLALARRRPSAFPPAFAALVLVEALLAAPYGLHTTPAPLQPPPVPPAAAPGARLHTPAVHAARPGQPDGVDQEEASLSALGWPGHNVTSRVENVDVYSGLVSRRLEWARGLFEAYPQAWRRYGVTHLVLPGGAIEDPWAEAAQGGVRLGGNERLQVWAVPHRPWASFAPSARTATGMKSALLASLGAVRAGSDEVVVEAAELPPTSPGQVRSVARGAEALAVEGEAVGPALLVVNDAWWPGWEAEIDGVPATILVADGLVRAVPFPAGRHRLVMRYDPPEVRQGLALSGLGLVLLSALAVLEERSRRARAGAPTAQVA